MPTEGSVADRRRISHHLRPAHVVAVDGTIGDLPTRRGPVAVVNADGVLLGAVDAGAVSGLTSDTAIAPIMVPGPGTIRPELRIDEVAGRLRADSLDHVFVTTIAGVLLGIITPEDLHV